MIKLPVLFASIMLSACATNFTGSAYFEGGRGACEKKCRQDGLVMSGLVYMGEYSSACVCQLPGAKRESATNAAVASGVAGVAMQMERAEQQASQQTAIQSTR